MTSPQTVHSLTPTTAGSLEDQPKEVTLVGVLNTKQLSRLDTQNASSLKYVLSVCPVLK